MGKCCVCGKDSEYLFLGELCCFSEDCVETIHEQDYKRVPEYFKEEK